MSNGAPCARMASSHPECERSPRWAHDDADAASTPGARVESARASARTRTTTRMVRARERPVDGCYERRVEVCRDVQLSATVEYYKFETTTRNIPSRLDDVNALYGVRAACVR